MNYCKDCGTALSEDDVFCPQCGENVQFSEMQQSDGEVEQAPGLPYDPASDASKRSRKSIIKLTSIFVALAIAVPIVIFIITGGHFTNRKIEKLILESEMYSELTISDIEILAVEPLNMAGAGTDSSWQYVFGRYRTSGSPMYFSHPIDIERGVLSDITIMNPYMHQLWAAILLEGTQELNSLLFYEMKYQIENNGFEYFEDPVNAVEFLRDITSADGGIISTKDARQVLVSALPNIYTAETIEKWNEMDGFALLFEKDSAVPLLITGKTTTMEYKWNYPEAYLDSMDSETRSAFTYLYGPAYVAKEKWVTGLINQQNSASESGKTFSSYEAVKEYYDAEEIDE